MVSDPELTSTSSRYVPAGSLRVEPPSVTPLELMTFMPLIVPDAERCLSQNPSNLCDMDMSIALRLPVLTGWSDVAAMARPPSYAVLFHA